MNFLSIKIIFTSFPSSFPCFKSSPVLLMPSQIHNLSFNYWYIYCLSLIWCYCDKILTTYILGRKEFIWTMYDEMIIVHHWQMSWQKLKEDQRHETWSKTAYWLDFNAFLMLAFTYNSELPSQWWHNPHWAALSLHQTLVKKIPHRYTQSPIWWRKLHNWSSLFSVHLSLCKTNQHNWPLVNLIFKYITIKT